MNFVAVIAALAFEQLRGVRWRATLVHGFRRYARALERRLNAGTTQQGAIATALALVPPVLVAGGVYLLLIQLTVLVGMLWSALVLVVVMGFRSFSQAYAAIADALKAGDVVAARRRLIAWRGSDAGGALAGEIPKLAIEQGVLDAYRNIFATLFWFLLAPGPAGALLYRLTSLLAEQWRGEATTPMGAQLARFGHPVARLLYWLDWIPVRLTAMSFAVVGDFEDAVYCWRTQARTWPSHEEGILLASAAGALGCALGGTLTSATDDPEFRPELGVSDPTDADTMPSATGLVWRALLVWLVLLLLLTLAYWAP
ncbi:MAG TPA: CobD/CbiB family protein [Casimicrobiaceae bacterium]